MTIGGGTCGRALAAAALIAAGACTSGPARPGDPGDPGPPAALVATEDDQGSFMTPCEHSHTGPHDPIVHRGHPGTSHRHEFFGATTTDASSTAESLLAGGTTCRSRADRSAYWAPALLRDGEPVRPTHVVAYYRVPVGADAARVEAPPNGLEMIAGDQTASRPQDPEVVHWACGPRGEPSPVPLPCEDGAELMLRLTFDPCWDGENLGSPDHLSHLGGLGEDGACPASHPVLIPELTLEVRYPDDGVLAGGDHLTLASGPPVSGHGDALLAWEPDAIRREVEDCLSDNIACDVISERTRLDPGGDGG